MERRETVEDGLFKRFNVLPDASRWELNYCLESELLPACNSLI